MASKTIEINFWSDIACCWCYVGENILKQAIQEFNKAHPDIKVELKFHSYFIESQANEGGEDYMEFNNRKFKGDSWSKKVRETGKKYGCEFAGWKFWPNSSLCHKLISEAKKVGKSLEILDELFLMQYEQGKNVSIESTLNEVANKHGISNWNTEENLKTAKEDDKIGRKRYSITSVPFFLFPGDEAIVDDFNIETYKNTLEQAFDSL